jgi:hypothetical protein
MGEYMKHITKFSLAILGKPEPKPQTDPNPQLGIYRLSREDTVDTMTYGYTIVNEPITSIYDQMQQWLTEHTAIQEQDNSTVIINSLNVSNLDPAIAESYTDTIERIRRNIR